MSGFDPQLLSLMGIEETLYDFPLPLFIRNQMTKYQEGSLTLYHSQPRPLSEVALTRLIFQIVNVDKFVRFIRLPLITLTRSGIAPGPASQVYYSVPPALRTTPELNVPPKLRAELSMAFSIVFHLKPHALVLSHIEQRPLTDYLDHESYPLSQSFYSGIRSPVIDMLNTIADVVGCRRLFEQSQQPRPTPNDN